MDNKEEKIKKIKPERKNSGYVKFILAGTTGSIMTLIMVLVIMLCFKGYKYNRLYFVRDSKVDSILDKQIWNRKDKFYLKKYLDGNYQQQAKAIETLKAEKVIISPEQYSSDLSDYYNTLVAVLAALLVILNVISFFSLRTNAESELKSRIVNMEAVVDEKVSEQTEKMLLDSDKVHNRIQALLVGWNEKNGSDESNTDKQDILLEKMDKIEKNMQELFETVAGEEVNADQKKTGAKIY